MFYKVALNIDCWHKPSETWHTARLTHGLRAVSRKHALDKGLRVLVNLPGYADRASHPDWTAYGEVSILQEGL